MTATNATLAVAPVPVAAGLVVSSVAVAGAFLLPAARARAACVVVALGLVPVLLLAGVAGALGPLLAAPRPMLVGAGLAGLVALAALAAVLVRRTQLLPLLVVAALPFRVPLPLGGETVNLLLPLYLVIGAGAVAYAIPRLRHRGRSTPGRALGGALSRAPVRGGRNGRVPERSVGPLEIALLVGLVLYAAQAAYSTDFAQALKNVAFFYVPFAVLLKLLAATAWTADLARRCLGVALALAFVFAGVGFWEYATRRLLLNPKVIASNEFEGFFRVNSLFFDPNVYGRFLVLVMLALAGVLLWARSPRVVLAAAGVLAVLWVALVLTFSQSSFAALLAGLAVLALLRWRPGPVIGLAAAGVVVAVAVVLVAPGLLGLRLSADALDRASSGRVELMAAGLEMFAERPLGGFGSGSFTERFRDREDVTSEQAAAASHTIPITVAAEQGIVGLAAYALLLAAAGATLLAGLGALRGRGPPDDALVARAVLAACFAALLVHSLVYAAFLEDPFTWTVLGATLGLRAGARPPLRGDARPSGSARMRTASSSR